MLHGTACCTLPAAERPYLGQLFVLAAAQTLLQYAGWLGEQHMQRGLQVEGQWEILLPYATVPSLQLQYTLGHTETGVRLLQERMNLQDL